MSIPRIDVGQYFTGEHWENYAQVDRAINLLAEQLAEKDRLIAELRTETVLLRAALTAAMNERED